MRASRKAEEGVSGLHENLRTQAAIVPKTGRPIINLGRGYNRRRFHKYGNLHPCACILPFRCVGHGFLQDCLFIDLWVSQVLQITVDKQRFPAAFFVNARTTTMQYLSDEVRTNQKILGNPARETGCWTQFWSSWTPVCTEPCVLLLRTIELFATC